MILGDVLKESILLIMPWFLSNSLAKIFPCPKFLELVIRLVVTPKLFIVSACKIELNPILLENCKYAVSFDGTLYCLISTLSRLPSKKQVGVEISIPLLHGAWQIITSSKF